MSETSAGARRWDATYDARGPTVSWYQAEPRVSLELIEALRVPRDAAVLDVGGGTSFLADRLLERGFSDVTVLELSSTALELVRRRLPDLPVRLLHQDLMSWKPARRYDLWHDRAVFHFLVEETDRRRYLERLDAAVAPGGAVIVGTFASDGPETCSGLPVARFSANDLAATLGERFELLHAHREEHTTPRGAVQPFTWVAGRMA
jgi:SAM-dependent methyltransferase